MTLAQDFFKPIITPYELEVALTREPTWSNRYVLDFKQVLSDAARHPGTHSFPGTDPDAPSSKHYVIEDPADAPLSSDKSDDDEPSFSLTTGKYRKAKRFTGAATGARYILRSLVGAGF
jgi:diphthamide biosynthesis protein 2